VVGITKISLKSIYNNIELRSVCEIVPLHLAPEFLQQFFRSVRFHGIFELMQF